MNINDRVKNIRTTLKLTQKDFGSRITLAQTYLSQIEKGDRDVTEKILKLICLEFNVNELWLRTGQGEMFIKSDTFSLDEYVKQRGMSDFELDIVKAYFDIDLTTRKSLVDHFKKYLLFNTAENISVLKNKTNSISNTDEAFDNEMAATEAPSTLDSSLSHNELSASQNEQIEKELALYRLELEAEFRGKTSLVSEKCQIG